MAADAQCWTGMTRFPTRFVVCSAHTAFCASAAVFAFIPYRSEPDGNFRAMFDFPKEPQVTRSLRPVSPARIGGRAHFIPWRSAFDVVVEVC